MSGLPVIDYDPTVWSCRGSGCEETWPDYRDLARDIAEPCWATLD